MYLKVIFVQIFFTGTLVWCYTNENPVLKSVNPIQQLFNRLQNQNLLLSRQKPYIETYAPTASAAIQLKSTEPKLTYTNLLVDDPSIYADPTTRPNQGLAQDLVLPVVIPIVRNSPANIPDTQVPIVQPVLTAEPVFSNVSLKTEVISNVTEIPSIETNPTTVSPVMKSQTELLSNSTPEVEHFSNVEILAIVRNHTRTKYPNGSVAIDPTSVKSPDHITNQTVQVFSVTEMPLQSAKLSGGLMGLNMSASLSLENHSVGRYDTGGKPNQPLGNGQLGQG